MRGEGVIRPNYRMARLQREPGHWSAQAVPRPRDVRSDFYECVLIYPSTLWLLPWTLS